MKKIFSWIVVIAFLYIIFLAWKTQRTGVVQPFIPEFIATSDAPQQIVNTPLTYNSDQAQAQTQAQETGQNQSPVIQTVVVYYEVTRQTEIVVTQTPNPTYTPYPTSTPYPTPVPPTVIGDFGEGRKYTEIWDVWITRIIILFVFLGIGCLIIYVFRLDYLMRLYKHQENMEQIRLANEKEIQEKRLQVEREREPDRKIIVNSRQGQGSQNVQLVSGTVSKEMLVVFVQNYRNIGFNEEEWNELGIDTNSLAIIFNELIADKLINEYGWIDKIPTMIEVANSLNISRDDVINK